MEVINKLISADCNIFKAVEIGYYKIGELIVLL